MFLCKILLNFVPTVTQKLLAGTRFKLSRGFLVKKEQITVKQPEYLVI